MDRLNYVYVVFRPDGIPLYIGKGSGTRVGRHSSRARANPHYAAVLEKAGGKLPVAIIARNLTEQEAFALEGVLTRMVGIESEGGPLVNCGHGGRGGPIGVKHSEEWKAVRRLRAIELWKNETYRAKLLRADRGRAGNTQSRTDDFKAAVSAKLKGNTHTLGFRHSVETLARMSAARKGKPKSAEHRAKIGASNKAAWIKRQAKAVVD